MNDFAVRMDSDSSASLAGFVFGITATLAAWWRFGVEWLPAAMLFFPVRGLVDGLVSNASGKIVKHGLVLILYSVAVQAALLAASYLQKNIPTQGAGADKPEFLFVAACVGAGAAALSAAYLAASVVAGFFNGFALPRKVHAVIRLALTIISRIIVFAIMAVLLRHSDRFIAISTAVKAALSIAIGLGLLFSIKRALKDDIAPRPQKAPPEDNAGQRTTCIRHSTCTRLEDVVGMDDAKEQIRLRLIEPARNPREARKYGLSIGGGVMLYGPPGTGKTMLARAVAGELGLPFFMITAADVFGKYVGDSERNIRAIFAEVRNHPLSVLFIDEMEDIFPKRTGEIHETTRKVISILLQELDGLDKNKNPILILGATNVPWMIDEAFLRPGRFDVKVFVGLPDEAARRKILELNFSKDGIPAENGLVEFIASRTDCYSGADLKGVVDRIRQMAYSKRAHSYSREVAEKAIAEVPPTSSGELVRQIQEWKGRA